MLDRAHEMPPQLIAPLVAEEVHAIGGRDVSILLQDYAQLTLVSLPGRGLKETEPVPLVGSLAGQAFLTETAVEHAEADGVRLFLPLLDGSDEIGVMALTLDVVDDDDRRLLRRLAGLVADMLVTNTVYSLGSRNWKDPSAKPLVGAPLPTSQSRSERPRAERARSVPGSGSGRCRSA
ncbi:hypothetical protein [Actinomadura sp. KC216]|uniref:hypothetical protein n=1 Tax=Actinomadura sp. KC216 TaxID=2530370 RepID=UPI001A9DE8DA|nr:hypothetical protein [Actinomadura sp. KC216]